MVVIPQLCEYTENHRTVYFKRVNFMICGLYPFFKGYRDGIFSLLMYLSTLHTLYMKDDTVLKLTQ